MIEGWTKNLALLFNNALMLALWRALDFAAAVRVADPGVRALECAAGVHSRWSGWARDGFWRCCGCGRWCGFMRGWPSRTFRFVDCAIAPLGLPLFVVLLYRSWFQHRVLKRVSWKGRSYAA